MVGIFIIVYYSNEYKDHNFVVYFIFVFGAVTWF